MENLSSEIKILIVDDRPDNLVSMQTVLEKDGYTLFKASSGEQALKILLREVDFTLILMDVLMPNLNGFETASLIYEREKLKHIPIIFITANNNDNNAFKGYLAGAADYIYKPINPDLLRAKVSVFVELYRKNHLLIAQEKKLLQINNELEERVQKRTEELYKKNTELEAKNTELIRVNNDLDNFIYTASHDLKAPVANIEGLLNALFTEFNLDNEHYLKIKEMTIFSINKFKNTILDLTKISNVQKDNNDSDIESLNFKELIEDVKSTIKDTIEKNKAQIITNLAVSEIKFSKKNMRSILYNLISNAVKYCSPDRLPVVTITTKKADDGILLSVSDNGLGIDPDYQHKLFGMFKRLHDHVEGSGIGLYIVKRIIENNGGRIEVKSELDAGTTFNVYFKTKNAL
ncbi:MAG TPA: hybrid sensor histidine kinase/response regulator [Cytophagaceae bacterium]|jgi:two-component system sensor histidine kinase/response regulator|nr:hybrid sensor histidine kinase/response regulator [Cytophagaceae bacterium]